jgi:hypothetical protein
MDNRTNQPPATSQQYFSLRTNQPPATSQQYFSLRRNPHQTSANSQTNRLQDWELVVRTVVLLLGTSIKTTRQLESRKEMHTQGWG